MWLFSIRLRTVHLNSTAPKLDHSQPAPPRFTELVPERERKKLCQVWRWTSTGRSVGGHRPGHSSPPPCPCRRRSSSLRTGAGSGGNLRSRSGQGHCQGRTDLWLIWLWDWYVAIILYYFFVNAITSKACLLPCKDGVYNSTHSPYRSEAEPYLFVLRLRKGLSNIKVKCLVKVRVQSKFCLKLR